MKHSSKIHKYTFEKTSRPEKSNINKMILKRTSYFYRRLSITQEEAVSNGKDMTLFLPFVLCGFIVSVDLEVNLTLLLPSFQVLFLGGD